MKPQRLAILTVTILLSATYLTAADDLPDISNGRLYPANEKGEVVCFGGR